MFATLDFLLLCLLSTNKQIVFAGRIVHGEIVPAGTLRYMAALETVSRKQFCGGFLISDRFVITAAHCEHGHADSVVLGANDLSNIDDTMRYTFRKCKAPFKFDIGSDIMLLKLSRPCLLQPVPLPHAEEKVLADDECTVVGWGATQTNGTQSDQLRMANVSIISPQTCSTKWREANVRLPDEVICAGGYKTTKGFCQGDSGGPLICNGKAVGVVSFNYLAICDYPTLPNVYTSLIKFLPWIKHAISQKGC